MTLLRNGPRPSRMSRVIVRVDTKVTTKARKHRPSGSLPAAMTSRSHHEPMPRIVAEPGGRWPAAPRRSGTAPARVPVRPLCTGRPGPGRAHRAPDRPGARVRGQRCPARVPLEGPIKSHLLPAISANTATRPYSSIRGAVRNCTPASVIRLYAGLEIVNVQEEAHPAPGLPPDDGGLVFSVSPASSRPVPAPGGRTTTHRLGRPSFVSGGGVLHQLEAQHVHEEADRGVVLADHDGNEAQMHRASIEAAGGRRYRRRIWRGSLGVVI